MVFQLREAEGRRDGRDIPTQQLRIKRRLTRSPTLVGVNPFFDDLGARFAAAGERRGLAIDAPRLSPVVAGELLELARVAAHTQERRFAPLASYLAGVFAERLATERGFTEPQALAALIREVREELEREGSGREDV